MGRRICVVGVGRWGMRHAQTLRDMGALAGVADTDGGTLRRAVHEGGAIEGHSDIQAALAAGYDGYVVATPAATHFEIARRILEAGGSVLVEKPLALSSAEARQLVGLAERGGLRLMVGHVLLFHPAIRAIRGQMDAGRIGRLQYLYSNRLNLGTVRSEENILWSFAPHDVSIFQHLVGARPVDVVSRGASILRPEIHDSTLTILKYPGNVSGHIFVSWLHPFKEHRLVIIGDKGMFTFEDGAGGGRLLFYEKGIDFVRGEAIPREGPTEEIPLAGKPPLTAELEYFVECLGGASPPKVADGASGVEVLEILEEATASLLTGVEARPRRSERCGYFVHPTSMVDEDVEIGEGTRIWHYSHVQQGARIGAGCTLGQNVNIGGNVRIGDGCKIQNNVSVYEGVELEDHVFCGPSAVFTNIMDPRSKYPQRGTEHYLRTVVREGATIGANATILCGHTLGRHSFIAAGAVVTKDVPDFALMAGVPALRIGWVCECGERLGKIARTMKCRRCGRRYRPSGKNGLKYEDAGRASADQSGRTRSVVRKRPKRRSR